MNKKAFTLVELMVVVLIIAILAAIAIPVYDAAIENQNNAKAKSILEAINGGMERFAREYPNSQIPTSAGVYITNPPSGISCDYNGGSLSATNFVYQMILCGYIPNYNYGTETVVENDTSIEYRFKLQNPNHAVIGAGYVYMEPKTGANVSKKYCNPNGGNVCNYKAGINASGAVIEGFI